MILKTYFEEFIILLFVIFLGIYAIIFTSSFSSDLNEKECVEFYLEKNYILEECEVYRERLESLGDKE